MPNLTYILMWFSLKTGDLWLLLQTWSKLSQVILIGSIAKESSLQFRFWLQRFHIKYEVISLKIYHCKISSLTTHQIINKHPGNELTFINFTHYLFILLDIFHVKYYNIYSNYVKSAGYKSSQLPMEQVRLTSDPPWGWKTFSPIKVNRNFRSTPPCMHLIWYHPV